MARQTGLLKFEGTVGDLIFYKRGDNYFIRSKNKFNPGKRSPKSAENSSEFSKASSGSKLIREAFEPFYKSFKDGTRHNRLIKILNEIVKTDTVSERGKRNLYQGNLSLLNGFPLNPTANLNSYLKVKPEVKISDAKLVTVVVPSFDPETDLEKPNTATHIHLNVMAAAFDFTEKYYSAGVVTTLEIPLDEIFGGTEIELAIDKAEGTICLAASELQFYEGSKLIHTDEATPIPVHIVGAVLMPGHEESSFDEEPVLLPEASLAVTPEIVAPVELSEQSVEEPTMVLTEEAPVAAKKKTKTPKAPKPEPEKPSGGQLSLL